MKILDSIKNIQKFMVGDLNKTANLQNSPDGAPNFLLALALCCYTEYWGKLLTENKLSHLNSFNAFFKTLGECYKTMIDTYGGRIYGSVRCGLAHYYLIEESATINMGYGPCGVEFDGTNNHYTFNVQTYLEDFENAVDGYVTRLMTDAVELKKVENALAKKPLLT